MHIKDDTHGYIVVETILAFLPFAMAMIAIVMLINVQSMQSRVHHALTQTAHEVSILSYLDGSAAHGGGGTDTVMSVTNVISSIFPLLNPLDPNSVNTFFNFDGQAVTDGHLHSIFTRHLMREGQMPTHHGFEFTQSFVDGDTLVLIVTYDVDFMFAGPLNPFLRLTVTQQAATRLWRQGGGQGIKYFRSDL